jgi:hypothetical protein
MAKKLTAGEASLSRAFLHDLFEAGGLLKYPVRTYEKNYIKVNAQSQAKIICDEIKYRTFDFYKTDSALRYISTCLVFPLKDVGKAKRLDEYSIANMIAAFCSEQGIFWDNVNTLKSTVEMETYRRSILGNACWEFECFLSQQADKAPDKFAAKYAAKRTAPAKTGTKTSGGTRSGAPKSDYKSSGAKSGSIKGLIGKPGEKITFPADQLMFAILCASSKSKPQYAFIDPLSKPADPNVVRIGDPSGYTACKLFFKSLDDATAAIHKIESELGLPAHVTGCTPAKGYPDANGYFLVNTEVGPAYIKARKLNETIAEELDTDEESSVKKSRFPEINDIDVYTEAMFRE